jgi:CheY-like chemotaxis protein
VCASQWSLATARGALVFPRLVICLTSYDPDLGLASLIQPTSPGDSKVATQFPPPYVTVLVVDDERISRHVASRMLRELGLRVLEADGADEALDVFRISQRPIDLVLLDVVMPETDGVELARQIRAHRPGQRILFMSAHPAEVLAEHGLQNLDVSFLAKPYTMDELLSKVREAMDRPPAPPPKPSISQRSPKRS